jgi:hypothetical protein
MSANEGATIWTSEAPECDNPANGGRDRQHDEPEAMSDEGA